MAEQEADRDSSQAWFPGRFPGAFLFGPFRAEYKGRQRLGEVHPAVELTREARAEE